MERVRADPMYGHIGCQHYLLCRNITSRRRIRVKIYSRKDSDNGGSGETTESLFMKELERRSLASGAGKRPGNPFQTASSSTEKDGERPRPSEAPPKLDKEQLIVSRGLSSEGLEGLIPRAKELIKLGGSFWLSFLPLILAVSILFSALYLGFGESFIHGGRTGSQPPPYVDPYDLLSEPAVDPTIPFYDR
eukprot:jgi/Botrbrau1/17470/Bobra.0054s0057.1